MTFDESIKQLDAMYAMRGKDYVVTGDNHPEIMRAWSDHVVEQLEAERDLRDQDRTPGG